MRRSDPWLALGATLLLTACHAGPVTTGFPVAPALSHLEEVPSPGAIAAFTRLAFAYPEGPGACLCTYDRPRDQVFIFPASGPGVENVTELGPTRYAFDDGVRIYAYDTWREERTVLVEGNEVGGFAFDAAFDVLGQAYFLGQSDRDRAERGVGLLYRKDGADVGDAVAEPKAILPVNAVAIGHGGVTSLDVDGSGTHVVFTTADGGLYLFTPRLPEVFLLAEPTADCARHVTIDWHFGRYVAWENTVTHEVEVLDRETGAVEPVPTARLVPGAIASSAPVFCGDDPYHLVITLTLDGGRQHLVSYDLRTETLANLTTLNLFLSPSRVGIGL